MGDKSNIEWTDATWNPTTGCTKVSSGCTNCYAEKVSERLQSMGVEKYKEGFKLVLHQDALEIPLKWRKPRRIFVNSMSDLFHKNIPFEFIDKVFDTMEEASHHTFQILTKRPERMREYMRFRIGTNVLDFDNVWLGTSVENVAWKTRIDELRNTVASLRFLSCEPLLGPLGKLDLSGIRWVIVGGESGKNHRPIKPEWVRNIRDQCKEQGVAFFFKQWGGITPKSGGRELDGMTYSEFPAGVND